MSLLTEVLALDLNLLGFENLAGEEPFVVDSLLEDGDDEADLNLDLVRESVRLSLEGCLTSSDFLSESESDFSVFVSTSTLFLLRS